MKNINKLHEDVFSYLNNWSEQSRTRNNEINPYFYMRSVRDDRFKKGYWFPGNDTYLCISFWAGGDSRHKTPNIYFEINEKYGCRVIVVSKDSQTKYEYFEQMIDNIHNNDSIQYSGNKKSKVWTKQLSKNFGDWQDDLGKFLLHDKRWIDEFIHKNKLDDYEEFVSRFGFITSKDFDVMMSRVLKERDSIKEIEYSKHKSFLSADKLPYALLGISIENFQGIKSTSITDLRPDSRWIFVTGENGYGKTSILQAIALGSSNDPELEKYLEDKSRISLELTSRNEKAFPVRTKGALSQEANFDYGQFVIGYGPARLNVQSKSSENMEVKSKNQVLSLFENETLLKNINYELFASNYSDKETFGELEKLIQTVTKNRISEIKVRERQVLFVETLANGDPIEPMPLNKLAAGFRSIINIVIDIYLRFKKVHSNSHYSEFYGIVLIDEIENHLHPALQRELPITLSSVFPKIQFIISTHSPIPLLAAEKNSIILKVNRTKDEGVTIDRLDEIIDFPKLLPNTILTSPIFGFQNIVSESKSNDEFIRVETTFNELVQNDEQSKRIQEHLSKETTDAILKLLKK
jgi:predicted ATP-binding protein involved in virulence